MDGGGSGSRTDGLDPLSLGMEGGPRPSNEPGGADDNVPRTASDATPPGAGVVKCEVARRWSCQG